MVKVNMEKIRDKFAEENLELYDLIANAIEEDQEMELVCTVLYDIMLQRKHKEIQDKKEMIEVMKMLENASGPLTPGEISNDTGLPESSVREILNRLVDSDEIARNEERYRI